MFHNNMKCKLFALICIKILKFTKTLILDMCRQLYVVTEIITGIELVLKQN